MARPKAPSPTSTESQTSKSEIAPPSHGDKVAGLIVRRKRLDKMLPHPRNEEIRTHPEEGTPEWEQLKKSLNHDYFDPIVWNKKNGFLVSGHLRRKILLSEGYTHADAVIKQYSEKEHMARMVAANRGPGEDNFEGLGNFVNDLDKLGDFDLGLTGLGEDMISGFLEDAGTGGGEEQNTTTGPQGWEQNPGLVAEFGVAPFSILDARAGTWQARKKAWLDKGIDSGEGREEGLVFSISTQPKSVYTVKEEEEAKAGKKMTWEEFAALRPEEIRTTTSIFDPVLTEFIYRWWCPGEGTVLDPFAGGSVRGLVASSLGLEYTGVDLHPEQVQANQEQAEKLGEMEGTAHWLTGDSRDLPHIVGDAKFDFLMSCPPYADLEVYSEDPNDLSRADSYAEFLSAYREIIALSVDRLKDNAFAVWVVGEVRDKNGHYVGFVPDTIRAFQDAGMHLYNEAILVTPAGRLLLHTRKPFEVSRKLGKSHQNVLVFSKGDPKEITKRCSLSSFIKIEEEDEGPVTEEA